jgi:hypothetical protein
MPEVVVFCEDSFHERFITALLTRMRAERQSQFEFRCLTSTGGLARVGSEFREFLRDLARGRRNTPGAIIVLADANCKGAQARRDDLFPASSPYAQFRGITIVGVPDPHIERWMMIDSSAFNQVFGMGCTLPRLKCNRDEYKRMLARQIRAAAGFRPSLGGVEYAEDVVNAMSLEQAAQTEPSFGRLYRDLRALVMRLSP